MDILKKGSASILTAGELYRYVAGIGSLSMTKKEKRQYQVRGDKRYDRECFVPFTGNGIKICRLYEMGQCPEKYRELQKDSTPDKHEI